MVYSNYNEKNTASTKPEAFVPLCSATRLKLKNSNCNFSLYSPRMVSWEFASKELKVDESVVADLCAQSRKSFAGTTELIAKKQELQKKYLDSLESLGISTFDFHATTTSPFITGLGSGHPTETGMILDRNIGVPYIPASSIKGVLRLACAINLAKANEEYAKNGIVPDDDKTLVTYFGSMSQDENKQARGQLMFLDAYPSKSVRITLDIMNPHFGKYYSGENKQPVETESPIPIKFLTVAQGTEFIFRCAFMPLGNKTLSDSEKQTVQNDVDAMFKTAFETVGFGGKTAIGYGRFKMLEA